VRGTVAVADVDGARGARDRGDDTRTGGPPARCSSRRTFLVPHRCQDMIRAGVAEYWPAPTSDNKTRNHRGQLSIQVPGRPVGPGSSPTNFTAVPLT